MDISSSLDIASNAIQIVDFSARLLSRARDIYESETGRSEEYQRLVKEAQRLRDVNSELTRLLAQQNLNREPSATEKSIISICTDCDSAAEQLLKILNHASDNNPLRPHLSNLIAGSAPDRGVRKAWKALQAACREMWTQRDISTVLKRIESLKQSLASTMIVNMQREILESNRGPSQLQSAGMGWDGAQPIKQWIEPKHLDTKDGQDKLISIIISNSRVETNRVTEPTIIQTWSDSTAARELLGTILEALEFETMKHREYQIPATFFKTFQWIYQEPQNQKPQSQSQLWYNFVRWLTSKDSMYWITGKAGSGKSTLMKMIHQDHRTKHFLRQWSGDTPIISGAFFFWNSGSNLQMSREGFIRSILHQVITQRLNYSLGSLQSKLGAFALSIYQTKLSENELIQLFRILVEEDTSTKYFFLFDGLDEFENREGIATLIKLVHTLGSFSHVKLCVSSRPWVEFQDAFKRQPSLMLERLTFDDIKLYVNGTLSTHPAFTEFSHGDPEYARKLVDDITTKASGVFLWVVLTVRSLVEGLANGDRVANLESRLNELPSELEELFEKILHGLKGPYFSDAAHLFKIYQAAGDRVITVLTLSFADEAEVESLLSMPCRTLASRERYHRATTMKRRLNSRCKGLLEIQYPQSASLLSEKDIDDYISNQSLTDSDINKVGWALGNLNVHFLHRTVNDYLKTPEIASRIQSACSTKRLNPQLSLCLAQVYRITAFKSIFLPQSLLLKNRTKLLQTALLDFFDFTSRLSMEDKDIYIRMMDVVGQAPEIAAMTPALSSTFWSRMIDPPLEIPHFIAFAAYVEFWTYVEAELRRSKSPASLAAQLLPYTQKTMAQPRSISLPEFDENRKAKNISINRVEHLLHQYGAHSKFRLISDVWIRFRKPWAQ